MVNEVYVYMRVVLTRVDCTVTSSFTPSPFLLQTRMNAASSAIDAWPSRSAPTHGGRTTAHVKPVLSATESKFVAVRTQKHKQLE